MQACKTCKKLCDVSAFKKANGQSNTCANCRQRHAADQRKWTLAHPEAKRANARASYQRHKATINEKAHLYYLAHCEEAKQRAKDYRQQNLDRALASSRAWRIRNLNKARQDAAIWRNANRERVRMSQRKYKALKAATPADVALSLNQWTDILSYYGHRCAYCLSKGSLSMDHVQPLSRGGTHTADNTVPACISCNASKNDRTPLEWLMAGGRKHIG